MTLLSLFAGSIVSANNNKVNLWYLYWHLENIPPVTTFVIFSPFCLFSNVAYIAWVNVLRIIAEFRILRPTFYGSSRLWCLTVSSSLSHWYPGSGVVGTLQVFKIWFKPNIYVSWSTSELRMRLTPFKPSSKIFYWPFQGGTSFVDLLCFCSVLCLLCLCERLFICALWSPAGRGLTPWLSFVVSICEFVTFPLISWVRCGTWLYRFLIFARLLTLKSSGFSKFWTFTHDIANSMYPNQI